jgi:hypothetical protein
MDGMGNRRRLPSQPALPDRPERDDATPAKTINLNGIRGAKAAGDPLALYRVMSPCRQLSLKREIPSAATIAFPRLD